MDGHRFDSLTRRLATTGTSRRGFLGVVLGLGAGLAGRGVGEAACPPGQVAIAGGRCVCKSTGREPGPEGCPCPAGQTNCNGTCRNLSSDVANCGSCGNACPPPPPGACQGVAICRAGVCASTVAPAGTVCRPAVNACDVAEVCDGALPECPLDRKAAPGTPCDDGNRCTQSSACDGNGACVGGTSVECVALDQCHEAGTCDPATGACSNPAKADGTACNDPTTCTTGDTCQGGICVPGPTEGCPECQECRGGACQAVTNGMHCGGEIGGRACCGGVCCAAGEECLGNTCHATCLGIGEFCGDESECCQDTGQAVCDEVCCRPPQEGCAGDNDCCGAAECREGFCCKRVGSSCDTDGDCCLSGFDGECGAGGVCVAFCQGPSGLCELSEQCCGADECIGGHCRPPGCLPAGYQCANATECCQTEETFCATGPGGPLALCCHAPGGTCRGGHECCGDKADCRNDRCCQVEGGACGGNGDCCGPFTCSGGVCTVVCPAGTTRCGLGCCPNDRDCCSGSICCATGTMCTGQICEACLPLQATCDPGNNMCCQVEPTICVRTVFMPGPQCCRQEGRGCQTGGDCCKNVINSIGMDSCGTDNRCGGAGASCQTNADCVDGRSCIGLCTGPGQGFDFCMVDDDCPDDRPLLCTQKRCIYPHELPA